jgi:transposase
VDLVDTAVDVIIGIDPHKRSSTTAALDRSGRLLQVARFATTRDGHRALRRWAARWPARLFAVEGASGLGRPLAQQLLGQGEAVVDVPAKLAARVRLLSPGHNRKSDPDDAIATARAALHARGLRPVAAEDHTTVLRLLTERRDHLVAQRTRTINRLHVLLTDLIPAGTGPRLTADRAARLLRRVRTTGGLRRVRRELASDLVGDVRQLDRQLADLQRRITRAVTQAPTSLPELFGIGPVLAAKLLGEVGAVGRFASKAQFASYTGTAPIEASSGEVVRHRLSRAGNRQLNHALHLMALCQISHDTAGRAYYQRKLGEGKSSKEALRCLKRRLSDIVYQRLVADQRRVHTPAA